MTGVGFFFNWSQSKIVPSVLLHTGRTQLDTGAGKHFEGRDRLIALICLQRQRICTFFNIKPPPFFTLAPVPQAWYQNYNV